MCIGGVYGGLESGVTESTTDVFLESAYFHPTWIRKTARRFAINSDASFRFERGIDPNTTVYNLKELVGIMTVVGVLNQVMTLTGARGLVSLAIVILPIWLLFAILWLVLPVAEGVLQYAVAPLIGVPLIMLFNMKGYNPIIALSAWAVMWPVGDSLPPTAVVGRAAVLELDFKGHYYKDFLKTALVPMLFVLAVCTIVMIFNSQIGSFLGV